MARILVIQFRKQQDAVAHEREELAKLISSKRFELEHINAMDDATNWSEPQSILAGYNGIILGGSGDLYFDGGLDKDHRYAGETFKIVESMRPFLEYILSTDFPTFGLCFGHQVLAYIKGIKISQCNKQSKTGSFTVYKSEHADNDPVFCNFPAEFVAQYAHKDALIEHPEGAVCLLHAGSPCRFSALRYGKNIYTVQFHPELSKDAMGRRLQTHPEYLPSGKDARDIFEHSPYAGHVLTEFVEKIVLKQ